VDKYTSPMRDENDALEAGLRHALARRAAPDGFAERLMARAAVEGAARQSRWSRLSGWREITWYRGIAAGLVLALAGTVMAGYRQHEHQQQVAGEHARQQVMLALHITAVTLESVDTKINEGNDGNGGDEKSAGSRTNSNDLKSDGTGAGSKEEQP
jgi:hypothetical protein